MKPLHLFLACLLMACGSPGRPLETVQDDAPPDTAYALMRQLRAALDSLDSAEARRPTCDRVWRAELGDSVWNCSDPRPPAPR